MRSIVKSVWRSFSTWLVGFWERRRLKFGSFKLQKPAKVKSFQSKWTTQKPKSNSKWCNSIRISADWVYKKSSSTSKGCADNSARLFFIHAELKNLTFTQKYDIISKKNFFKPAPNIDKSATLWYNIIIKKIKGESKMKISRDEICNGCTSLQFGAKKCLKFNTVLNTFTNSEGYISVFPCAICGRNDYTPRAKKGKINGK